MFVRLIGMSRDIKNLAHVYDVVANEINDLMATGQISVFDNRLKEKINWLHDVAKALSLVYQIEKLRGSQDISLPPASSDAKDTIQAPKKAQQRPNPFGDGWRP